MILKCKLSKNSFDDSSYKPKYSIEFSLPLKPDVNYKMLYLTCIMKF